MDKLKNAILVILVPIIVTLITISILPIIIVLYPFNYFQKKRFEKQRISFKKDTLIFC